MALVVDFDGTITIQDTIGELATYATIQQHDGQEHQAAGWTAIVKAYENEYRHYVESYIPREDERTSIAQEIVFLRGLAELDARSRRRVEDLELFVGIGDLILQAADWSFTRPTRPVTIRAGFKDFVAAAKRARLKVVVVSANWSTAFIKCAIGDPEIEVVANNITNEGKIVGPPGILKANGVLATSYDKKLALDAATICHPTTPRSPLLYVGDSLTDLECLTTCPGVVMSEDKNSPLLQTLSRLRIRVTPMGEIGAEHKAHNADMYWAKDFYELLDSGLVERLVRATLETEPNNLTSIHAKSI